jgi:starvation-inducible DNA-binding protein
MHPTKNDLPQKVRSKVVAILGDRLADATDLMLQGKQAHWNVKGPNFIALHELFDKVVESAEEWVDLIAERIVQLGGQAEGTVQATAARTSLPEYPLTINSGKDHVEALSSALAALGKKVRSAIDKADKLGDKDTADLFTEISRDVDKYLWFVEAHNQSEE